MYVERVLMIAKCCFSSSSQETAKLTGPSRVPFSDGDGFRRSSRAKYTNTPRCFSHSLSLFLFYLSLGSLEFLFRTIDEDSLSLSFALSHIHVHALSLSLSLFLPRIGGELKQVSRAAKKVATVNKPCV